MRRLEKNYNRINVIRMKLEEFKREIEDDGPEFLNNSHSVLEALDEIIELTRRK